MYNLYNHIYKTPITNPIYRQQVKLSITPRFPNTNRRTPRTQIEKLQMIAPNSRNLGSSAKKKAVSGLQGCWTRQRAKIAFFGCIPTNVDIAMSETTHKFDASNPTHKNCDG